MEQLYDFFRNRNITSVLDLGTGSGDFIAVLKKAFPKASITGTDVDGQSLENARSTYPDVNFMIMEAEHLTFDDNSFDAVTISKALHHLSNPETAFAEMKRVVKPGGWIIVSELFSDNLSPAQEVHKMFHHFRSRIDRLQGISHHETFRKNEILALIREAGIEIVQDFDFNPGKNFMDDPGHLDMRTQQMEQMLESIRHLAEYDLLRPQVGEFREKALAHGFVPATRVVVIGRNG